MWLITNKIIDNVTCYLCSLYKSIYTNRNYGIYGDGCPMVWVSNFCKIQKAIILKSWYSIQKSKSSFDKIQRLDMFKFKFQLAKSFHGTTLESYSQDKTGIGNKDQIVPECESWGHESNIWSYLVGLNQCWLRCTDWQYFQRVPAYRFSTVVQNYLLQLKTNLQDLAYHLQTPCLFQNRKNYSALFSSEHIVMNL